MDGTHQDNIRGMLASYVALAFGMYVQWLWLLAAIWLIWQRKRLDALQRAHAGYLVRTFLWAVAGFSVMATFPDNVLPWKWLLLLLNLWVFWRCFQGVSRLLKGRAPTSLP